MVDPERYLILFFITNFTNFPISLGLPIFFVGRVFSNFFKFFTKSFTLLVLNGPGAILITEIFFLELSIENDFSKLLIADLSDDDITSELPGSLIIEEEI